MSVKHKWHKEIKAWADGAEIECRHKTFRGAGWEDLQDPMWLDDVEYRIKQQPKEEPYWLCCGCKDPRHNKSCLEAKMGHPERCRYGTASEHYNLQPKPKYLYVYKAMGGEVMIETKPSAYCGDCIGKIKLEVDDD